MILYTLINPTGEIWFKSHVRACLLQNYLYNNSNGVSERQPLAAAISITPGKLDPSQSISELLDSCILYYYAVAHKYIIMVYMSDTGKLSKNLIDIFVFRLLT